MKKIYTLILMAAAAISSNAQVALVYQDEILENNSTTEILAQEVTTTFTHPKTGQVYEITTLENLGMLCDPTLINLGESDANVTVTAVTSYYQVNKEDEIFFTWCGPVAFTQLCEPIKKPSETRRGVLKPGEETTLEIHPPFHSDQVGPEHYGSYDIAITINDGMSNNTYNLIFTYDERSTTGVHAVKNDTAASSSITDLQGRRVAQPQAGNLYIQNGRKLILK